MSSIVEELHEENQNNEISETSQELKIFQEIKESENPSPKNHPSENLQLIKNLKFSGKKDLVNPKYFIENFERFADQEKLDENSKQNCFIQSLVKYAAIWMEEHGYGTYEEMKEAFLAFYWSQDIQKSYENHLECGKYSRKCKLSIANYFYKYGMGAKYLDSAPSEMEIISKLSVHFGPNIENEFLKQKVQTMEEAIDMLKRIEALKWSTPTTKMRKNFMTSMISPEKERNKDSLQFWGWVFLWLACSTVALNFFGKQYIKN